MSIVPKNDVISFKSKIIIVVLKNICLFNKIITQFNFKPTFE